MDKNASREFALAFAEVQRAMYVYQMNRNKESVKQKTVDRMRKDLMEAAKALGNAEDLELQKNQ